MAQIKFLSGFPALEPWSPISSMYLGALQTPSATSFTVLNTNGTSVVFHGQFTVSGGVVTGGTVTGFDALHGSTKVISGKGLSVSALDVLDSISTALSTGNSGPLFEDLHQGVTRIVGSELDDVIIGPGGDATLIGKAGNDRVWGAEGNEVIKGGDGNDQVSGGGGADTLWGNEGRDTFLFWDTLQVDRVKDFNPKDDLIALDKADFVALGAGYVDKSEFAIGKAAGSADVHLIYNRKDGGLYYDADGAGGVAQVQIAQLTKGLKLKANDFILVDD
jgi:Ca2+-binding RTX toxin-like protein